MRRSKFSESQRLAILAEQDGGKSVEEICRKHQIDPATLYKWKQALAIDQDETKTRSTKSSTLIPKPLRWCSVS